MEHSDVKRLGLILAVQAEIEGMKIKNYARRDLNLAPAYGKEDFQEKAEDLRNIVHCHELQL